VAVRLSKSITEPDSASVHYDERFLKIWVGNFGSSLVRLSPRRLGDGQALGQAIKAQACDGQSPGLELFTRSPWLYTVAISLLLLPLRERGVVIYWLASNVVSRIRGDDDE